MTSASRDGGWFRWAQRGMGLATLWVLLTTVAWAQSGVELALPDGGLFPGVDNRVEVGAVDSAGIPVTQPPSISADGAPLQMVEPVRNGVWSYRVPVGIDAREVDFGLFSDGRREERTVPVVEPRPSNLEIPRRTDMVAGADQVTVDVLGDDLPPVEALHVVVAEGRVAGIERADDRIRVSIALPDDPTPRVVPVGVSDRRFNETPAWGTIRVWTRPQLPLESEPDATVTVRVGAREYGPWTVDAEGRATAVVDQYPGERVATAEFVDDLGNRTSLEIPLAVRARPTLMVFTARERLPGGGPEPLYVRATTVGGYAWTGAEPACQSPVGLVPLRALGSGMWMTTLPALAADSEEDLRLDCTLAGGDAEARATLRPVEGVPSRLRLRAWPQDLRSDYPYAELRAVLEDASGERLSSAGVTLSADGGAVRLTERRPTQVRGEYDGSGVGESGTDTVRAVWSGGGGGVVTERLGLAWEDIPRAGRARVVAFAQDAAFRGVGGERVQISAGGNTVEVETDAKGFASVEVAPPLENRLWTLSASLRGRRVEAVVHRGQAAEPAPEHDLSTAVPVTVTPGRIAGISVQVDPPELRVAPGAVAFIYVRLEDREGNAVQDEAVEVTVSEGEVGELRSRADGTWVAEYRPGSLSVARQVDVTARASALRSTTQVALAPRPLRLSVGPWAGVTTNFSGMTSPVVGVDVDARLRSRLTGEAVLIRLGMAQYNHRQQSVTGLGGAASLAAAWVPVSGMALVRRDRGRWGLWGGAGVVAVYERLQVQFGDLPSQSGGRLLVGPGAQAGVGWRWVGGEFGWSVRTSFVARQPKEVGFSGNVGGVATGLAYRLVF